jgi:nicotinamidase-related amidase
MRGMSTALVLIDLQNDYFPGGAMELVGSDEAVANAARLLEAFRRKGAPAIHVQHIAQRPGATFFLPGTPGAQIHAAVRPAPEEPLVVKHFPNGFRETTLLDALRTAGATRIVFAGMMTHMCVDTTVRAAADLGFACDLAHDACATRDLAFGGRTVDAASVHIAYLAALNGAFASVRSTRELIAAD